MNQDERTGKTIEEQLNHCRQKLLIYYLLRKKLCQIFCIDTDCDWDMKLLNNKIVTVSKGMKKEIIKLNVSKKKVISIYDGINFSEFSPIKHKEYLKENIFEK